MPFRARRPPCRPARLWAGVLWLGAMLAGLPLGPARPAEFSPQQRQEIETIVRDYLAKHPQVLLEALQQAEEKLKNDAREKAAAALVARRREVFEDPETPIGGNAQGDVSLVEFFDYRCPYCKEVEPALEILLGEDRHLRFVYKEFPVLGPESVAAAHAALAAKKQGKYQAFHRALMAAKGRITDDTVMTIALSVGLDVDRLKRDMAAPEIDRMLKANLDLAAALDIRGTPGFVIGKEIVPGAIDLATLKLLIAEARKQ